MSARLHVSDAKSSAVRKRIDDHQFENEEGEEYEPSKFGGFADYFRRKKIKLQNLDKELRSSTGANPPIFRGVVAHVNGYTQPSLNDLHKLIVTQGGGFLQYLDGKTVATHIIASSLTPKKRVEFRRYRIVKPAWVVDSVKAGRLLPWDDFRVIDEGKGQKVLGFDGGRVVSQANEQQRGYRDQTTQSWYTNHVRDLVQHIDGSDDMPYPSTQIPPDEGVAADDSDQSKVTPSDIQSETEDPNVEALGVKQDQDLRKKLSGSTRRSAPDELAIHAGAAPHQREQVTEEVIGEDVSQFLDNGLDPIHVAPQVEVDLASCDQGEVAKQSNTAASPGLSGFPQPAMSPDKVKRRLSSESLSPSKRTKMTAEEHNAVLLADPRMRKSSVLNPDFLKQYYSESRLHHLSTWKAELKSQLQQLTTEKSPSQKIQQKRPPGARRYILHVDFDSFFAAVSLKNAPHLKDKPVAIAHGSGSGSEIASCNYPARKFGIKNGMWMKHAHKLCPDLKVLPYDYKGYEQASKDFYDAILSTGGIVQSVSVDEALVDVTALCLPAGGTDGRGVREGSIWREQAKADEIASGLRDDIRKRTGCAVSVGIGGNVLLAKVALRKAKPAGQHHIKPEEALDFVGDLTVQDLPGVAYSIGGKLEEAGVKYVKDVRQLTKEKLISILGPKTGEKIWDYSRGIDRTEVGEQVVRKSVSAEVNWGVRFETQAQADEFIHSLCGEVHRRLVGQKVKGRHLTMKVMRRAPDAPLDPPKHLGHGKCDVFNKSVVLGVATNAQEIISKEALSIMRNFGFSPGELRGLGVQMTKLEPLKGFGEGQVESSQKRLHFKTGDASDLPKKDTDDPIVDYPQSPPKAPSPFSAAVTSTKAEDSNDQKALNTSGTQFMLPTQVDPSILAELPEDIRSKLFASTKAAPTSRPQTPATDRSRSHSPAVHPGALLNESQLDPDTLDALPEDVRREVLETYHRQSRKGRAQALLPQSPRKVRKIIPSSKKPITPTKKRAGLFSRTRGSKHDTHSTLTQSNFVASKAATMSADPSRPQPADEIAPDFLAALPPDIRREVLAQQRLERLQRRSNLNVSAPSRRGRQQRQQQPHGALPQRRLRIPPRPPKPVFTTQKLSSLPELRDVISEWVREFADEAPNKDDVAALIRYLAKVVSDERDLAKAVAVVRWLAWVVDEAEMPQKGREGWDEAVRSVKEGLQVAVAGRGLGRVEV